jgi:hypothetical protein
MVIAPVIVAIVEATLNTLGSAEAANAHLAANSIAIRRDYKRRSAQSSDGGPQERDDTHDFTSSFRLTDNNVTIAKFPGSILRHGVEVGEIDIRRKRNRVGASASD